jgi:predicted secreted protein
MNLCPLLMEGGPNFKFGIKILVALNKIINILRITSFICCAHMIMPLSGDFDCELLAMPNNCEKIITHHQNGQEVNIDLGGCFRLIVPNPGAGGYLIQTLPEFDSHILSLQGTKKKLPRESDGEGNFGSFEWLFKTDNAGLSEIIIRAGRPWEKDKSQTIIFKVTIKVTP